MSQGRDVNDKKFDYRIFLLFSFSQTQQSIIIIKILDQKDVAAKVDCRRPVA